MFLSDVKLKDALINEFLLREGWGPGSSYTLSAPNTSRQARHRQLCHVPLTMLCMACDMADQLLCCIANTKQAAKTDREYAYDEVEVDPVPACGAQNGNLVEGHLAGRASHLCARSFTPQI